MPRPESRTLIREAWRLAQGLHAELLVAYYERELADAERRELARTLELAEDLNGRIVMLKGAGVQEVITLSSSEGVNHIVVGSKPRGLVARLLNPSIADQLSKFPGFNLHLVGRTAGE